MTKQLRGIVLAGGTGSRLFPLTKVTNKHLLPVGKEPMIFHPIKKLIEIGIDEILIVTGTEHVGDVIGLLGSGKDFGCEFTYRVQDTAGGIAQALGLGEGFARGEQVAVILGDNIFQDSLIPFAEKFMLQPTGGKILLKEVEYPDRFGVAVTDREKIHCIVEKPNGPPISKLAVTGMYFYHNDVFDIIKSVQPSIRGEWEITDVNNVYVKRGTLSYDLLTQPWTDAGTFDSLRQANELLLK